MTFRSFSVLLGALAALSGCRIEKPAAVVPKPPTITRFSSSAAAVERGAKATLSWETTEATTVELREAAGGELALPADLLNGSFEVTINTASVFVLVARGPGGSDARAVSVTLAGQSVGELTLQALPPIIPGGASSALAWTAPGASQVSITAGAQPLDLAGQRNSGAVTVTPRFDTTYTLTADGVTRSVDVVVQPAVLTAEVNPRAAEVGDPVTLRWTAAGGTRLVVSSPGRGQLFESTTESVITSGSFDDVVPPTPNDGVVTYQVTIEKGTERATRSVEVNVGTGLAITRFEAPPTAAAGASYLVRWETRSADQVVLAVDGVPVFTTSSPQAAAGGLFALTAPTLDFAVTITATNTRGARASQQLQVDAVGVPTAATLTVNPASVAVGQAVTLTFASLEARRSRIVDSDGVAVFSVTGQAAEGGSVVVYPSATTTYTLRSDNLLGNPAVTASAPVTVTGTAPAATQFPPTAISGQTVAINSTAELLAGFPHTQVLSSTQADFRDISTTGTRVLETGSNVTSVDLPFSTFLWGQRRSGLLTISRAGWMAWGAPLIVNSTNATSLPTTSGDRGLIAPFWDDLTLIAGSGVYVQVVGSAPEEILIVQWDKLQVGSTSGTEATFQVQVHQRGLVSFRYRTMDLPSSPSFLTGLQDHTQQVGVRSTATPASNSALYFFSPVLPPIDVQVRRGSSWGGFAKVGESWSLISKPAGAYTLPRDIALTEVMFRPNVNVASGQYLEVVNRTAVPLDMTGWALSAVGMPTFQVPAGFTLQPNVPTVIGASTDSALNDDAGVSLSWGSFALAEDGGTVTLGITDAGASVVYPPLALDAGRGEAIEFEPGPYAFTSGSPGPLSCVSSRLFGSQTPQQLGSPGAAPDCGFGYTLTSITPHFVDISGTGTRLVNSPTTAVDTSTVSITLAISGTDPAPFAFGVRRPVVSMSLDGWMIWGSSTTGNCCNDPTTSTTSSTKGKVAVFWDDMQTTPNITPVSDMFWKQFAPNEDPATPARHWVFQWAHIRHYSTSPADDLNFEVKLFEDGSIEYHYGSMTSGTTSNYANGNSSSVWLEKPDGTVARAISVNEAFITPNSAYRFVPR